MRNDQVEGYFCVSSRPCYLCIHTNRTRGLRRNPRIQDYLCTVLTYQAVLHKSPGSIDDSDPRLDRTEKARSRDHDAVR